MRSCWIQGTSRSRSRSSAGRAERTIGRWAERSERRSKSRCFLRAGWTLRMSPRRFEKFSPSELMFVADCGLMEISIARS